MIDGTYQVILKTPMGAKKGELILKNENGILSGSMTALGKSNLLNPGTTDGQCFEFSGELQTAVGKLAYECKGQVKDDAISGIAKTKKGNMALSGKKVI